MNEQFEKYSFESFIVGCNFARHGNAPTIVSAEVTTDIGDIVASDVEVDGSMVLFKISGGSPTPKTQRLKVVAVTDTGDDLGDMPLVIMLD